MSSSNNHEKAEMPGLTVTTTASRLIQKPSQDTFASDMSANAEKNGALPRSSDVSTPSTAHQPNPFDTDIEAIISPTETCGRKSTLCSKGRPDCQMWPGQDHWRNKAKLAKKKRRNCNCLAHLSKRNRLAVKILIALLIIGIAVGVGVGVSKPLGAGIWHSTSGSNTN